jgi:hypothetical protein
MRSLVFALAVALPVTLAVSAARAQSSGGYDIMRPEPGAHEPKYEPSYEPWLAPKYKSPRGVKHRRVPKPRQGRISTYLAKQEMEEDSFMRVARHGDKDAVHAVTYYAVVETAAQQLGWLSLKPVTGFNDSQASCCAAVSTTA